MNFRKKPDEIDEEMAFHLESAERDLRAQGEPDARRAARLHFGNPLSIRDAIVVNWLETTWQDLRFAVRSLAKAPAMTAVIVTSLALGIGANTAIFSLTHALLLRTLPVRAPGELYRIWAGEHNSSFTNPQWEEFRASQRTFSSVMAWSPIQFDLSEGGAARMVDAAWVSGSAFHTLGLEPALGRLIHEADDRPGAADGPVAVLGHDFWISAYGGATGAVGGIIRLNGKPFKIVGVAPEGFRSVAAGERADVMVPIATLQYLRPGENGLRNRGNWWLWVMGRLDPAVSLGQARAQLYSLSAGLMERTVPPNDSPDWLARYRQHKLWPKPLREEASHAQETLRLPLLILMSVAGLVLLIACANVANLLLARAAARGREMAVRLALGASRTRLFRQLLTESLLLSGAGALAGLALAPLAAHALMDAFSVGRAGAGIEPRLDPVVLGFTSLVALICGLAFGVVPAWRAVPMAPQSGLRDRPGSSGPGAGRLRSALVAAQVALSVVLLSAAGLFITTLRNLAGAELGFRPEGVLLVSVDLVRGGLEPEQRAGFTSRVLEQARRVPGVQSASASALVPLSSSTSQSDVSATLPDGSTRTTLGWLNFVSPSFFETFGTPLLSGRDIAASDRPGAPPVAVVNETLARQIFGAANPVGRTLRHQVYHENVPPTTEEVEIVGLVRDARYGSLRQAAPPTVYFALAQQSRPRRSIQFALRTAGRAEALVGPLAAMMKATDARVTYTPRTFSTQVREAMQVERLVAALCTAFGALALLLAAIGLYGVLAYSVAERRAEIGVRMALGATPARIRNWVLGRMGLTVAFGATVGVGLALWASRFARSLLYGVQAGDARVLAGGVAVLLVVAAFAAWWPARRAARVDPMTSLRCE
jgi:predicted permease